MRIINNILYLEVSDLIASGVSEGYIWKSLSKQSDYWMSIEAPEDKRKRLIEYDSIPPKTRSKLDSKEKLIATLLEEQEAETKQTKQDCIDLLPSLWAQYFDGMDIHWFQRQIKIDGKRARDLATCTAMLRLCQSLPKPTQVRHLTGLPGRKDLMIGLIYHINQNNYYGLPTSYDRFRAKASAFDKAEDGRTVLIPAKFGVQNALKIDETHRAIIIDRYLQANKLDLLETHAQYEAICKEKGLEPVSYSSVKKLCKSNEVQMIVANARHGRHHYETSVRPFVQRKEPEYSFSLVAGDGWMPGRTVVHEHKGKKRVSAMTVWFWYDWKTKAILSYRIAATEDSRIIRQSFRDIVSIHGKVPLSVMVDKKWESQPDTGGMFEKLDVFVQQKRAYNPKSNIAERSMKEINKLHRIFDEYWADMTNNTVNFKHNPEHLRDGKPLEESDFRQMIHKIVAVYNNEINKNTGKRRVERALEHINPSCKAIDPLQQLWVFGEKTIVTIKNGWFKIQIAGKKYEYQLENWPQFLRRNIKNNRVKVYYDEAHMETVDIYEFESESSDTNDRYITTCDTLERMNAAQVEQKDSDLKILGKHTKRGVAMDEYIEEQLKEVKEELTSLDLDTASVHAITQQKYKEAQSQAIAKMYTRYYEEIDREEGVKVPVEHTPEQMDAREKYKRLKNIKFD